MDPHISIRVVTWLLIENPPGYFLLQIADVLWLFCDHPPLPFPSTKRKWYCSHSLLEHLDSWDMCGSILPSLHHHHESADIVRVSLCILILEHLDTCDWASSSVQHDHDYWVTSFQITKMRRLTVKVHLSNRPCRCCAFVVLSFDGIYPNSVHSLIVLLLTCSRSRQLYQMF